MVILQNCDISTGLILSDRLSFAIIQGVDRLDLYLIIIDD